MQNPDKYKQVLQDVIRKVVEAAPLFQQKLDEVKSIEAHYTELCNEEEELQKQKLKELNSCDTNAEECEKLREAISILQEQYQIVEDKLKSLVITEAKLANKKEENPLIFSINKMAGPTSLIQNTRIRARLISLKKRVMQKMDKLHEWQQNVYCFDELPKSTDFNPIFALDHKYQDIFDDDSDLYTANKASQYILEHYQDQYQPNFQRLPQKSISNISNSISHLINEYEFPTTISLDLASFKSQQFRKEIDNRQFNIFLSSVATKFENIMESGKELNEIKEQIFILFDEIDKLYEKRQEILNDFYSLNKSIIPTKIFSCITTLVKSSEAIRKTQTVINTLSLLLSRNSSIPTSIWENEHQIRTKMKQLLNSIDHITDFLSKTQRYVKIKPFGYQEVKKQIEIEEISPTQINQCQELVLELQNVFASLEKEKYASLEEISNTINSVEKIKQHKKEEEDRIEMTEKSLEKESSLSNLHYLSLDEDEDFQEIMRKREEVLEKQNEELRELMEKIEKIPDELKDIRFNIQDLDYKPKELHVIELPAVLSDDDNNDTDAFQNSNSQLSLISEMNNRYIEEIKAKNYGQITEDYSPMNQEPKKIIVKNEKLESIIKSIQPKSKPIDESNRVEKLIEKKNRLIAAVNDLPNKIQYVKQLKSEIENMEKQIKNLPRYRENKMKDLERKKLELNELNEQISERENSEEYKQYKNICDKIVNFNDDI